MSDRPGALMLLDAASLYFRAFYGVPDRRRDDSEEPNNAVRGFLDMIATLIDTHRPERLVACWDDDWRPAFRVEAIPTYKTHRLTEGSDVAEDSPELLTPQVPAIVEALAGIGIQRVGCPGFEADDVIGTLTTRSLGERPVSIVTGDRDLFQLVDDAAGVEVLYTARGGVRDPDVVDEAYLKATYDVTGGDGYADFAALRGDPSDGLPGVKGVGAKTAAALLHRYGTLDGLIAAVRAGDPAIKGAQRTRLEEGLSYLERAPQVVRVVRDCPLPEITGELPTSVADLTLLSKVAASHRLGSSVERVLTSLHLTD